MNVVYRFDFLVVEAQRRLATRENGELLLQQRVLAAQFRDVRVDRRLGHQLVCEIKALTDVLLHRCTLTLADTTQNRVLGKQQQQQQQRRRRQQTRQRLFIFLLNFRSYRGAMSSFEPKNCGAVS